MRNGSDRSLSPPPASVSDSNTRRENEPRECARSNDDVDRFIAPRGARPNAMFKIA